MMSVLNWRGIKDMLFAKLLLALSVFWILHQLLTGKAYGGSYKIIRRRLSERPGQRSLWGWQTWFYKEEWPRAWWFAFITNCVLVIGLVLWIWGKHPRFPKLPPQETLVRPFVEFCAGMLVVGISTNLARWFWRPSRSGRKVWGIGSPRTVGFYLACVLSLPVASILTIRSDFRLGFLFFIPFGLLIFGRISARIDAGKTVTYGSR